MSLDHERVRVALYVNDFLPYTHGWIYRQVEDPVTNVCTVLCHNRVEEKAFPFKRCMEGPLRGKWLNYLVGRFWFVTKYFRHSINQSTLSLFKKELQTQNINLVHAHFGTNGVLIASLCKDLNIPLVVTFHGFDISSAPLRWPAYRKQLQELFIQIKYAIAISEEMKERLILIGCPEDKIKVSYLGVPLSSFPYVDRSRKVGPLIYLHAGRLTAKKGVLDLVLTFIKISSENVNIPMELWIVGDGEERILIDRVIKLNKTSKNNVKLLGRLSDDELQIVRQQADVFVLNCRTDEVGTKEGLPISILESSATALPVISTFHAGIPESINQNKTGVLVNEFDNAALEQALVMLFDRDLRLKMGQQAHEYMKNKFDLVECNKVLAAIYGDSIKK